jgi:hypothetical protein
MPAITKDLRAQLAGIQKAPRHEVASGWALACSELCGFNAGAALDGKRDASRGDVICAYWGTEESAVGISAGA